MKLYCVLWMPTVVHKDFVCNPKDKYSNVFEISDNIHQLGKGDKKIYCKLHLLPDGCIVVGIYDEKEGVNEIKELMFTLCYLDNSHNGLFKYEIDLGDGHENSLLTDNEEGTVTFPCDIYNRIKEFYHKHNFHKVDDGDSMIKPYISPKDVDIHRLDNDALKHYLAQYEKKFLNGLKYVVIQYDSLVERSWFNNFGMLMLGRGKHHSFYRLITRMKGDKAYYNSLLYSCYNTISDLSPIREEENLTQEAKKSRRSIFNVVNSIECLNVMEERINNIFNVQISVISFWVAIIAVILSVVFFILPTDDSNTSNTIMLLLLDIWSKIS